MGKLVFAFVAVFILSTKISADQNKSLFGLFQKNDLQAAKELISQDPSLVDVTDSDGWTPLMYMAYHGNLEGIRFLVDFGADIDRKNSKDETSLMIAIASSKPNVVTFFIEQNANIDIVSRDGFNATYISGLVSGDRIDSTGRLLRDHNGISPEKMTKIFRVAYDLVSNDESISISNDSYFRVKENVNEIGNRIPTEFLKSLRELCLSYKITNCEFPNSFVFDGLKGKITRLRKKIQRKAEYGSGRLQKYAGVYATDCKALNGEKYDFAESADYYLDSPAYDKRIQLWSKAKDLYYFAGEEGDTGFNISKVENMKYLGDQQVTYVPDIPETYKPTLSLVDRLKSWRLDSSVYIPGERYESQLPNGSKFILLATNKNVNLGVIDSSGTTMFNLAGNLCRSLIF